MANPRSKEPVRSTRRPKNFWASAGSAHAATLAMPVTLPLVLCGDFRGHGMVDRKDTERSGAGEQQQDQQRPPRGNNPTVEVSAQESAPEEHADARGMHGCPAAGHPQRQRPGAETPMSVAT